MRFRGSITIFFTLLCSVMISVMGGLLLIAKISAGRVQVAAAADQTLFSAMAKYDRQLFEEYHLLYIDGGYGTGTLQLGKALDEMESDLSYLLTPNKEREIAGGINFLQLVEMSGSITGYTLATDCEGQVFQEQVVSYMKDTVGLQGISLLTQKLKTESHILESQENLYGDVEGKGTIEDYENIKKQVQEQQTEESKNIDLNIEDSEHGLNTEKEVDVNTKKSAQQAQEVMDTISVLKKSSLLQLVLPDSREISGWSAEKSELLRNRNLQEGMGYLELSTEKKTMADSILFQEYILQNLNCYGEARHGTGPAYGVEWVLFGKLSDVENLESMVTRLLLIREAVNAVSLYNDEYRYEQVRILAEAVAAVLKIPSAQTILEGAITLAWAYSESIVDVYGLLDGREVPLIKESSGWQVEFVEILPAIQNPGEFCKDHEGMTYSDYLRIFLFLKNQEEKITGCMEVIEQSMREWKGKTHFSMDCAIDSLEAEFEVQVENHKTFTITEKRSYRTM